MSKNLFLPADILLPKDIPFETWSVIACDQFSSERKYWDRVAEKTKDKPSIYHMIVPEAYLGEISNEKAGDMCAETMNKYLEDGIFRTIEDSYIYVERKTADGKCRRGLVGKIDLDAYDYKSGSESPVRASEKTVIERLPPRISVRSKAALEIPHIMVLIDDPERLVIEPLTEKREQLEKVYDFDLMENGGHITGYRVSGEKAGAVLEAMNSFEEKPVQMVVGDGNHSLVAAKECWNKIRAGLSREEAARHPARYALVEVNNVYDDGIQFEPIHRVLFGADFEKFLKDARKQFGANGAWELECVSGKKRDKIAVPGKSLGGMIAELQGFIDDYVGKNNVTVDYIHGDDSVIELTEDGKGIGIFMPYMNKSDLFATVISDGVFPKKSFSIGHAGDKRYYLECRKIR